MNLEQLKARLEEITNELGQISAGEIEAEESHIDAILAEGESLKKKIKTQERIENLAKDTTASTGRKTGAPKETTTPVAQRAPVVSGFENVGNFFANVRKTANGQKVDAQFEAVMKEANGEDGGFLVPEEMMSEVMKKLTSDESLLSRTRQFTVSGNNLTLPIDETSPWNGGILAYWLAESGSYIASKHKFGQASWKLNKVGVLVKVTDELLEDTTALASYITTMAPEAIMHAVNSAIISGNGVGKPKGILNSGFRVVVAKESGQIADTIVARNVIKMYSKMIPASRARAVWYINAGVEEQLRTMKDDEGKFIYLAPGSELNQTPYGMLLGRPVVPMLGSMPALGDEGDIVFADLSYYYTLLKASGMKQSVSAHLLFDRDEQAYKFTLRIDGGCPFQTPVKTEFGDYEMSGIVTLADRA